ncbi:MAG: ABC-F family ATP-binding cassette domain-containing protein [Thermomicrobiales bacterium]
MLSVNSVSKRYGDSIILDSVTCIVNAGDRVGLIGPNGAGKSTLLRIMLGHELPDSGSVSVVPDTKPGFLRQGFTDLQTGTLSDLLDIPTYGLLAAARTMDESAAALADPALDPEVANAHYDQAIAKFDARGGYSAIDSLVALLDTFRLGDIPFERELSSLSGGQKTRAGLAALLSARPDLLILDEPTNHLDSEAQSWLADFLTDYRGAVLVVSHDRGFLDRVINHILELDGLSHRLKHYAGTYSDYSATKRHEEEEQAAAWHRQQKEVRRIEQDIRSMESKSRHIENNTIDFAIRKKAAKIVRPAVVRKAKLERMLDSEEAVDKPTRQWGMSASFAGTTNGPRDVAILDDVHASYGDTVVLRGLSLHIRHGDRLAITGPNGSGKTTLLRLLTGELQAESGSVRLGHGVRLGYFAQEQEHLDLERTVIDQARREADLSESDLRTFLHRYLFGGDTVHRHIGDLSYGERARLMLALLALRGTDLLLLDEPLNHLDINARENFEQALEQFEGTIVFVGHDQYAIDRLANQVIELRDGRVFEPERGVRS